MSRPGPFCTFGWVIAAALFSMHGPVRAETPGTLAGRLDEAIRHVDGALNLGGPLGDPGALFPETEEAAGPGGRMQVDHSSLRAEWQGVAAEGDARRESLERLRHRLVAVRAELTLAAGVPEVGTPMPANWREKLSEILSRPEFKKRPPEEDWRVRLVQWLREKLGFLIPRGTARTVSSVLGGIIYVLAAAALIVVLYFLIRAALPLWPRDRQTARAPAPPPPEKGETPESLLALADGRTSAGDLRGAAQAMFRWMLLRLHRTGRLEYDPALTNHEHLTRLTANAGIRAAFERVSSQFELAWYGFQPVAPEELAAFRAECQRVAGGEA